MKTQWIKKLSCLTMVVLCLSVFTATAEAAVVWSEDFNTGMDGWTTTGFVSWDSGPVVEGNFSTDGNQLTVLDDDVNYARRESTVVVGTWSFDMYVPDTPNGYVGVAFMSNGTRPLELDTRFVSVEAATVGQDRFNFWWMRGPNEWLGDIAYIPTESIVGWHHIDITRTSGGLFNVYFNGSFEFTTVTNDVTQSTYFECFGVNATGAAFDNIVVNDEVWEPEETTPTPTTPPPEIPYVLVAVGVGVAVVIVLAVVCLRRR
jgi:hypothetical protein